MSNFNDKLVQKAVAEEATFKGVKENRSPLKERIGVYWDFLGRPELDGGDDVPWSAAFVSFMVKSAGAGALFPYSAQHSVYIYRTINDHVFKKNSVFLGFRPGDVTLQPGDIIGMNRSNASPIDYDWALHNSDYLSHCDIVVDAEGPDIEAIGGNVSPAPGSVGRKTFVKQGGQWVNKSAPNQKVFVVIRSFLP